MTASHGTVIALGLQLHPWLWVTEQRSHSACNYIHDCESRNSDRTRPAITSMTTTQTTIYCAHKIYCQSIFCLIGAFTAVTVSYHLLCHNFLYLACNLMWVTDQWLHSACNYHPWLRVTEQWSHSACNYIHDCESQNSDHTWPAITSMTVSHGTAIALGMWHKNCVKSLFTTETAD